MANRLPSERPGTAAEAMADLLLPDPSGSADSRLQQIAARALLAELLAEALRATRAPSPAALRARIHERLAHADPASLSPDRLALLTLDLLLARPPQREHWQRALAAARTIEAARRVADAADEEPPPRPGFPPYSL